MAYDSTRGYVVLFGGNTAAFVSAPSVLDEEGSAITPAGDTWLWHGDTQLWDGPETQANPPCPRSSPGMSFDADGARNKVILFGGDGTGNTGSCPSSFYNDTWFWNGSKWVKCTTGCGTPPAARFGHRMEWDPATVFAVGPKVVLFGGQIQGGLQNDTWGIDGGAWTSCPGNCTPPSVRCCVGLVYSPLAPNAGLLLYGGQKFIGNTKTSLYGTWLFNGATWNCLTTCQ